MDYRSMEFHLAVTTYVGSVSTLMNGVFVLLIFISPPDNLGIFRSQYYVGAFANFFFASTQTWSANLWLPNGTLFVVFSARRVGTIGFLLTIAALTLQFKMLSSNFAVRYAAVRGGWMRYYLTNKLFFYSVQLSFVLGAYIPPIYLLSPTPELRLIANETHGAVFNFNFMKDFFFVCSYDYLTLGNLFIHQSIFLMAGGFQGGNLLIMLVCGVITYLHISHNTQSAKLRKVNNRLLRARIFQACFSFLFLFMPNMLSNASMLLRVDASSIAPFLSSMVSFGTLFNPFVDFTLTPGYRKRISRIFFNGATMRSGREITISTGTNTLKTNSQAVIINVK